MKSFLVSKPRWVVRHKKKIISCAFAMLLAIVACLYFAISAESRQKDLELQEAKIAAKTERARIDSVQQVIEQRREQRRQEKIFYWNGADDEIEQIIFEKIAEAGIQKTKCSGNGMLVSLNKINCRANDEAKIICSYFPRIIFTNCDNKPVTFLEKNERFRSSPQTDEAAAKEDLANKLREADFSDWILEMKGLK
jgi:membrane-associated HD superfamily phosphohydrolase